MRFAAALFITSIVALLATTQNVYTDQQRVMAAYYMGDVPVSRIPAQTLSDIIYAFGEPGAGNICHPASSAQNKTFAQLRALRRSHPHLRLLVSIGGWAQAPQY